MITENQINLWRAQGRENINNFQAKQKIIRERMNLSGPMTRNAIVRPGPMALKKAKAAKPAKDKSKK